MARQGKLFSNTLLLGMSAAAGKAISFLLLPFFTEKLTPAEFGVCEILISTALLMIPLFSLYAPQATFRFLAEGEQGAARAGASLLGLGLLLFLLFIPVWGRIPALRPYRAILLAFVFCSLLRSFAAHVLRAKGHFFFFSAQQLFCTLLTVILQIFFLRVLQNGVRGYLWGIVLGDGITFLLLSALFLSRRARPTAPARDLYARMLRFSLPLIPAALLWWGMSSADRYILLYFHGERATGLYAAAARFPSLITFAASVFLEAWHYAAVQGKEEERGSLFGRIYSLLTPLFVTLGGVAVAFSPVLVSFLLSDAYADAARVLGFLLFGAVCAGLASFLDSVYSLQLRTAASFYTSALSTGVHLGLSFLLVPPLGAVGAAVASALGFLALFVLRAVHTAKFLKFPRQARPLSTSLLLLFLAGGFFAGKYVFFGVLSALFSILPMGKSLLHALLFLLKRSRAFLVGVRKKQKYIEKDRKL